jgi:FkbH-like protein
MTAAELELVHESLKLHLARAEPDAVRRILFEALEGNPTPAEYERLASALNPSLLFDGAREVRIAVLARDTLQPLRPFLHVRAFRSGLAARTWFGPAGQLAEPVLAGEGGLREFDPEVVVFAGPPNADFGLYEEGDAGEAARRASAAVELQAGLCRALRERSGALQLVHNFLVPLPRAGGAVCEAVREANRALAQEVAAVPDAYLVDYDALAARWGKGRMRDERLWHLGRIPVRYDLMPELAEAYLGPVRAWLGLARRCLVLDCDNLLWGGVVGELGLEGIGLGPTYPGSVHLAVQREVLALFQRGVVLALNSRNNAADVLEVFERHPHALLRPQHFGAWAVNWAPKPENMRRLAGELDLALEHMAFLDDDPRERGLMREALPEVLTLEVGADLGDLPARLAWLTDFQVLALTPEDRARGLDYAARRVRRELQRAAPDLDGYYASLATRVRVRREREGDRPRVAQLIKKTNQFNLTCRRHGERELEALRARGCAVYTLEVEDRFGDSGLSGVAIVEPGAGRWRLDTLLVSCRVLGRGVERAFLAELAARARARGARVLEGEFRPGSKNAPARDFFAQHGFRQVSTLVGGAGETGQAAATGGGGNEPAAANSEPAGELWEYDLAGPLAVPAWIAVAPEPGGEDASAERLDLRGPGGETGGRPE